MCVNDLLIGIKSITKTRAVGGSGLAARRALIALTGHTNGHQRQEIAQHGKIYGL